MILLIAYFIANIAFVTSQKHSLSTWLLNICRNLHRLLLAEQFFTKKPSMMAIFGFWAPDYTRLTASVWQSSVYPRCPEAIGEHCTALHLQCSVQPSPVATAELSQRLISVLSRRAVRVQWLSISASCTDACQENNYRNMHINMVSFSHILSQSSARSMGRLTLLVRGGG